MVFILGQIQSGVHSPPRSTRGKAVWIGQSSDELDGIRIGHEESIEAAKTCHFLVHRNEAARRP